jgi:preprotein translocase subunit SecE
MSKSDQRGRRKAARKGAAVQPTEQTLSASSEDRPSREDKRKNLGVAVRKDVEKKTGEDSAVAKYVKIALQFLRESRMELKKVKWPTRKELLASTAVVIALVLVVSFFLGVIDFGLIKIIKKLVG